jgi:aarF domain-containing kinase
MKDPGNVIIMPDGRLGLIDYGMVGRLTHHEREQIASTMLAIQDGDKEVVVRNYLDSGYRAGWITGGDHSEDVIYRFVTLQLDRIDLSPVNVNGEQWSIIKLLSKSIERGATTGWIDQMKRIGGLLIGVASQAGRPISLSREWYSIATKVMKSRSSLEAKF